MSQTVVNQYITGGKGGAGGQGGVYGGDGGLGEGPTLYQKIKAKYITMNMVQSPTVVEGSRVVNSCPPASRIFHGRRTILDAMHQFFTQDTKKQKVYVLYGLGGAGKTQIALKFIEETMCFTEQFLLDASTTETIQNSLKNITSQDALTWLAGKYENWLLFFDNADDPTITLNQFFPRCNHGNIIITSRNPSLQMYGTSFQVSDMEESDAVALLLNSSQQEVSASNQLLAQAIVKYAEAKELWIIEVENQTRLHGEDGLNTLALMNNLANGYHRLGQFEEAEKLQSDILEKRRRLLGEDDLYTVTAMHSLAATYHVLGRFEDAEKLKVIVLEKRRRLLGDDHPATLDAMHNPAATYHNLGQFEEAAKLSLVVVKKWKQLASDDHPKTLDGMHSLAITYDALGCFKEAEKLQVVVLEKQKKIFGEDHSDTLKVMNNLGYTNYHMGHFAEAEALQVVALEKWRKLCGEDHPDTQHAMQHLIRTYHSLDKQTEAAELEKLLK
ncbi:FabD/lysophospholipase-like protein [Mycena sanguinolenta]|uniref:FabD/lysophospholipase-like protein n=1 Tax=Mycena sanguinolenta TaxID=230812 RepID=A0A8H7DFQ5_9AGAR|nr:FabD/lysophospholipase-like protein [Mycena sanguinolenta]